jgi:uncharacterized repeat protein (TIGR02543 family)
MFALIAILTLLASVVVFAQGDEDWVVYMTLTTDPDISSIPGEGAHFGFGAKDGASDEYNSVEGDEITPPDPVYGINAYFCYPSNPPYQDKLILSVTGPSALMTWPLVVKMVGKTGDAQMTISWSDIGSVPTKYTVLELQDTEGTTLADMRSVDHYTLSASQGETYNFQIKAEVEEATEYNLTIGSTDGGKVTTPGEGAFTYNEGEVVDLTAEPDEGYRFAGWTGHVNTIDAVNDAETTITMNGGYSITANFKEISTQYSLTIDSTVGGEVTTPGEGTFTYEAGMVIDIVAEAEEGYQFVNWTGDVNTTADIDAAETTITMDGNYFVTANFEEISLPPPLYTLTINSTAGGTVNTPGVGTYTYAKGMMVNLAATSDAGYRFVNWTGNTGTIPNDEDDTTTITMDGNYFVTANFEEIPPVNWPLIGGAIAAVVVAGPVIFFVHRRRAA